MPAARLLTAAALLLAPALFVGCEENDDAEVIAPAAPAAGADVDMDVDADGDMDTGLDGGVDDTRPSNELDDM